MNKQFGAVAQLGERLHGMEEVASSILVSSTKFAKEKASSWEAFFVQGDTMFTGNRDWLTRVRFSYRHDLI